MSKGPKPRYEALVKEGVLAVDPAQGEAVDLLESLHHDLRTYQPQRSGLLRRRQTPPIGIYLWGGVGRGKTLLMDLFYNNTDFEHKRRVHFHEFMTDIHERIGAWRSASPSQKKRHKAFSRSAPDDPMPPVAFDIAKKARLLCFDEFHVGDITDAMILGRLFTNLFNFGAVVVATSNRQPDDLYKDGLNRQLFLPFIALLKERTNIFELKAEKDYRLSKLTKAPVYYQPLGAGADKAMNSAWRNMISGAKVRSETVPVKSRTIKVPRAARGAARFEFDDLCAKPLGASDYHALIRHYATLFIDHIPVMEPEKRNEAHRFITLIDTIYDTRTKLVCSADGEPGDLYPSGDGAFEFERTASRLMEMRSTEYLAADRRLPEE